MSMKRRLLLLTLGAAALLLACQTLSGAAATPEPPPTYTPYPTYTPLPPTETPQPTDPPPSEPPPTEAPVDPGPASSGTLLYADDFSNTGSGWDVNSNERGSVGYYDDGFRIEITIPKHLKWANPNHSSDEWFTDVRIEVDTVLLAGGEDNSFGVLCRYQDPENFYALVISSDGYFAIRKRYQGGSLEVIHADNFTKTDAVNLGGAENHITAECVGDRLRLWVNGIFLIEHIDGDIPEGDVGVITGTFDAENTQILFDNYEVYAP